MKKFGVFLATLLLVMLCVPTIMACSCSRVIASGYYKVQSVTVSYNGTTETFNIGDDMYGRTISADMVNFVLQDDKTGYLVEQGNPEKEFSWSQKRTNVKIEFQEETMYDLSGTISGNTLSLSFTQEDGARLTYTLTRKDTIKVAGNYNFVSFTAYDTSDAILDQITAEQEGYSNFMDLKLMGDGTYILYNNGTENETGKWRVIDTTLTLVDFNGEINVGVLDGDVCTLETATDTGKEVLILSK